jgi:alkanesulfonate monooxygenase SsuD/methylene tetrahydromethanopterin reductase-like flavin-dependent oxidoreductase (luciferase family)
MTQLPAVSLVAPAGKRAAVLDLAVQIEQRGFSGIACPSLGAAMALCTSLAHVTSTIPLFTSIQPIYLQHAAEAANTASHIDEVSGGRFSLGLGVSHGPVHDRLQVDVGRPLSDTRDYVAGVRAAGFGGRVILATLRDRMLDLSVEVADGAVWANASRSHMPTQLTRLPADRRDGFFVGNMIPTVIDDDIDAARAVNRKTLTGYVRLPNYRNYWKAAGYVEEMEAIETAIAERRHDDIVGLMSDRWLDDCTLSGSVARVRDGLDAWRDAGVTTPIAVMSSTRGGQVAAIGELFDAYA